MRYTKRSLSHYQQALAAGFSFTVLILVVLSAGQRTLAQTAQGFPPTHLLSAPRITSSATRPRRVFTAAPTSPTATGSPSLDEATEIERRAFENTNAARRQYGLPPLVWDSELCRMARNHSESMVRQGFFAHETPDGLQPKERARAAGILHFRVLGENIAYNQGYDDPGAFAVERWMISPGHRANILSNLFEESAIGSFVAPDGTVYLTQEFIKR
jgi:uncharacterized protein YkwD